MTLLIIIKFIYEAYFRFPHFKIVKVGVRRWKNKNKDELTSYQIELKTKKASTELVFEELWIDEKKYKFNLSRENRKFASSFLEKEVLNLNISSEIKKEFHQEIPVKSSKGILILGYTYKNKRKYVSIKKFKDINDIHLSADL